MRFDFHCHSHYSDGSLSPEDLAIYANEREISLLALTDHDSISGIAELKSYIAKNNFEIKIINGIEISALSDFGEVHVVGLGIDLEHPLLKDKLALQIKKRWQRATEICEKLAKLGVNHVFQAVEKQVKEVATRTHIAQALVELNYVKDKQQAFKKYIGKQGKIKIAKDWMTLDEVIDLIHQAGGISILAHPTRYAVSNRKLSLLLESFKAEGGQAIEMAYPSLNKDKSAWLELQREKWGFMASSGSDFHYPNLTWSDLGKFPTLSHHIPHVLNKLT